MDDLEDVISKNWANPLLLEMWAILAMPDWEDGEAILRERDIEALQNYVTRLNKELKGKE